MKLGAETFSAKEQPRKKHPRINTFLRREPSPEYAIDRTLFGGMAENAGEAVAREKQKSMVAARERRGEEGISDSSRGRAPPPNIPSGDHSDEDEEFPFARSAPAPKQTTEEVLKALEVPRNMGYVERRDFEQKLAARTIASIQEQGDVTRISQELAQALVKVEQQAQEIEKLKQELEESHDAGEWQTEAETARTHAAELEETIEAQEQEISALKEMLEVTK